MVNYYVKPNADDGKGPYTSVVKARKVLMDVTPNKVGYLGAVLAPTRDHDWRDVGFIYRVEKGAPDFWGLPEGTYLWQTNGYVGGIYNPNVFYILNRNGSLGLCLGLYGKPSARVTDKAGRTIYDPKQYLAIRNQNRRKRHGNKTRE